MLESATGPQIMEVNSSPGLEGIETCTKLDVASAIIEYIAARVDFADIDIRQRLTVSKGYGVSEIHVPKGSTFEGKTIVETDLRDKDINVLTLYRGSKVIPNPKGSRVLEANDRLLCFGKLDSMRGLLPPKAQRRRHSKIRNLDADSKS
jgi:ribosomal protein S6--L-glutamate ligase